MKRYDIINALIEKNNYKSYLEIGLATGETFGKINIESKESVDPSVSAATHVMTSDNFFANNEKKYDIIFIDGLHHSDQVLRDIQNSLYALNKGGTVVMHDCNPPNKLSQVVPRQTGVWTGDVWIAFVKFISKNNDDYNAYVVNTDFGCGIIEEGSCEYNVETPTLWTYEWLENNREEALNLITPGEFRKKLQ